MKKFWNLNQRKIKHEKRAAGKVAHGAAHVDLTTMKCYSFEEDNTIKGNFDSDFQ